MYHMRQISVNVLRRLRAYKMRPRERFGLKKRGPPNPSVSRA